MDLGENADACAEIAISAVPDTACPFSTGRGSVFSGHRSMEAQPDP
ncbi:hypothetical protein [Streptomyces jumonjinensis]|nr:hypothetical protein [Streptomyces jumonjinensis]